MQNVWVEKLAQDGKRVSIDPVEVSGVALLDLWRRRVMLDGNKIYELRGISACEDGEIIQFVETRH